MIATEFRCVKCAHPLYRMDVFYSDGRCPYCGFKKEASTITAYTEHPYVLVKPPWWKFWKRPVKRYITPPQ